MNPDLEHLVVLQAIDLERAHARRLLDDGPKRVARAATDLREAETTLAATRKALANEETIRRRLGSDADDRRNKLTKLRKQMDAATSTTQVSALEHEIAFALASISTLEDDELASLDRTETAEAKLPLETGLVDRLTTTLAQVTAAVAAQAIALRKQIIALDAERLTVRAPIDEAPLSIYDRISKSRGSGVSAALDHKCSACQMMVRPQRWNDLTGRDHANEIFTCETCSRMLFWDPRRDAPGPWPPGDRLKAAQEARP